MASWTRRRLLATAVAALALAGGAAAGATLALHRGTPATAVVHRAPPSPTPSGSPSASLSPASTPEWVAGIALPRTLQASLGLYAPSAAVPLRFQAPSVGIDVAVLGVGLTSANAVDAPKGPASSAVWDEGFWYRGGAEAGQPGVFALAGHVDRVGGAPAAFAHLKDLKAGAVVQVVDQRSGITWQYRITETQEFDMSKVNSAAILDRIYGPDVAAGRTATVPADLVPRISIITCAGTWTGTQYDHRFVAFGQLVGRVAAGA